MSLESPLFSIFCWPARKKRVICPWELLGAGSERRRKMRKLAQKASFLTC